MSLVRVHSLLPFFSLLKSMRYVAFSTVGCTSFLRTIRTTSVVCLEVRTPFPTKNLVGGWRVISEASYAQRREVLDQPSNGERPSTKKNELPIANRHATRSAFSRERLEVLFDQAALRIFRRSHGTSLRPCCPSHAASTAGPLDVSSGSGFHNHGERSG